MFDKYLIRTQGFRNVVEDGRVTGFEVGIRIAYYRGIALTIISGLKLVVDGVTYEGAQLRFGAQGRFYTMDELAREEVARWEFDRPATLRALKPGGLAPGAHRVTVFQTIKPSYIPGAGFTGEATRTMTLSSAGGTESQTPAIRLGVSLYSYQEEYFTHAMSLEDCVAEVAAIGATGVQLIAEQMMPAYPTPSPAWIESWHAMMAKYKLTPTLMDTFVDVECGGHRRLTLEEGVQQLVTQMRLAKSLGFDIIRPTTGPVADSAPDLIRLALPYAEELDVRIAPEIHAPIPLRGAYIESYLELIARTKTRHAGFTLDFGVFCKRLPPAQVAYALRLGAQPKVIDYVAKAYIDGVDPKRVEEYILANSPTPADRMMIHRYSAFGPAANEPAQVKDILPYVFNCHGKFYEFTEQGVEESIPYPEVLKVLAVSGYQGSIDSEYEGQRLTQDAFVTDSCEQVRRQHLAMRRVLS